MNMKNERFIPWHLSALAIARERLQEAVIVNVIRGEDLSGGQNTQSHMTCQIDWTDVEVSSLKHDREVIVLRSVPCVVIDRVLNLIGDEIYLGSLISMNEEVHNDNSRVVGGVAQIMIVHDSRLLHLEERHKFGVILIKEPEHGELHQYEKTTGSDPEARTDLSHPSHQRKRKRRKIKKMHILF